MAGPVMQTELGGSYADLQWITAAYTLAMAVGLLTGGRLGDLFGRRRMLLVGAAGFTLASLLCAAAPTAEFLIGSRALQGALGAVMLPQVFGLIRDLFPPDQMARAWAVLGPVSGLSAVLGPIVAGVLIDVDLFGSGWRSIFLINVPVGAYVLLVGAKRLAEGAPANRSRRLDVAGMALAGVGAVMLGYPLLIAGVGIGMVFVPLFDIVLAGVGDHEVGSASGILQALQQLGMSVSVAGLGTLFFGLLGAHVDRAADFVAASEPTILVTVALLAAAFAIGFLLPKHARVSHQMVS